MTYEIYFYPEPGISQVARLLPSSDQYILLEPGSIAFVRHLADKLRLAERTVFIAGCGFDASFAGLHRSIV